MLHNREEGPSGLSNLIDSASIELGEVGNFVPGLID